MKGDDTPHCTCTSRRVSEKRDSALVLLRVGVISSAGADASAPHLQDRVLAQIDHAGDVYGGAASTEFINEPQPF